MITINNVTGTIAELFFLNFECVTKTEVIVTK
jgi:hypothetical protein